MSRVRFVFLFSCSIPLYKAAWAFLIGRTGRKLIIHLGLTKAPFLLKNTELDGVSGYEGRGPEVTVSVASVVLLPPGWLCVLDQPCRVGLGSFMFMFRAPLSPTLGSRGLY